MPESSILTGHVWLWLRPAGSKAKMSYFLTKLIRSAPPCPEGGDGEIPTPPH